MTDVSGQLRSTAAVDSGEYLRFSPVEITELNGELRGCFESWYPGLRATNDEEATHAA